MPPASPAISVKEARKLLSPRIRYKLSDDQVETMVALMNSMVREHIRRSVPKV